MITIIEILVWAASVFLLIRSICVLNRVHMATWRTSPLLNLAIICMAVASALGAFGPFYGKEYTELGHASMIVCAALICILDKRRTWRARQARGYTLAENKHGH